MPNCSFLPNALTSRGSREIHILQTIYVVLLNQPNILLLKFIRQRCVLLRVTSRMIKLGWSGRRIVFLIIVDYHIICTTLESQALRIRISLRRLGRLSMMLLHLLTARSYHLIGVLLIYYNLMRIMPIIATV